jgi:hypothetical protein
LTCGRRDQVSGKSLVARPFADDAMHLAKVLAQLLQRKAGWKKRSAALVG